MGRMYNWLASPGAKGPIADSAPTQYVPGYPDEKIVETVDAKNVSGYVAKQKDRKLDRWLDKLVAASGSEPVFAVIIISLLTWAFLGIPFGQTSDWAVIISDVQAIVSYIFDSLLMRQQLNSYDKLVRVAASLRSRTTSQLRMLRQIHASRAPQTIDIAAVERAFEEKASAAELPSENWLGRASTFTANVMGHFVTICLYWVCIFIWVGFGHYCGWSNEWQLYINSATSALMVLVFAFLANIRERHTAFMDEWLEHLFQADSAVEYKLREATGDHEPNEEVVVPAPKMSRIQRAIFYYADLVGTLTGIAILIVVIVVWVAVGPALQFNSNWWLLIGTYAGLVGLNDGFVLRNVQLQLGGYEDAAFGDVNLADRGLLDDVAVLSDPAKEHVRARSLSYRLSAAMGVVFSHEITVVLGVVLLVGLLVGSSAMRWTETGQLLCNIPPSIIETFFMMILITGHNLAESQRRQDIYNMYLRRLKLLAYVETVTQGKNVASDSCTD